MYLSADSAAARVGFARALRAALPPLEVEHAAALAPPPRPRRVEPWGALGAERWGQLAATAVDWLLLARARATLHVHGAELATACARYPSSFSRSAAVYGNHSRYDRFCAYEPPPPGSRGGGVCAWKSAQYW